MQYDEYLQRFRAHAHARVCELTELGTLIEGGRPYPLLRARTQGRHALVLTAGFHGEEPAGPLTLLEHLPEVVEYARARDVGLWVYPCINPSGFEDGTRYNRSGEKPNNDFLRYEVSPGVWKGELAAGEPFLRWALYDGGPKETRAVRDDLAALPVPDAALDLHQDRYLAGAWTYAYVFGPQSAYAPMVDEAARYAQIARGMKVDDHHHTDALGLIVYADGSITDWYHRLGVPYAAALETTTATAMEGCHRVNLAWIRGFIDLAARGQGPGAR